MIIPRRIATMAALVVLLSSLAATPFAYAANCAAGFVGPYGTACGGDEELEPVVVTVKPPVSKTTVSVKARPFSPAAPIRLGENPSTIPSPAVRLGKVIFNGVGDIFATMQDVRPVPGKKSIVVAIPGNPVKVTVSGFRKDQTSRVEVLVQVSGDDERTRLGLVIPSNEGKVTTAAVTLKQGDSATFTLNQWAWDGSGIDYEVGLLSQSIVSISGTGVSRTPTRQLTAK